MFEFRGETNKESQMLRYGLKASVNRKVILNVPYANQARPSAQSRHNSPKLSLTASCLQQKEIILFAVEENL